MYAHKRCFRGFLLWTEVNDRCDKIAVDRRSYTVKCSNAIVSICCGFVAQQNPQEIKVMEIETFAGPSIRVSWADFSQTRTTIDVGDGAVPRDAAAVMSVLRCSLATRAYFTV